MNASLYAAFCRCYTLVHLFFDSNMFSLIISGTLLLSPLELTFLKRLKLPYQPTSINFLPGVLFSKASVGAYTLLS